MSVVIYKAKDAFRLYGGNLAPKGVLESEACKMVEGHILKDGDVVKDKESGKLYFRAFRYSFPFSVSCGSFDKLEFEKICSLYDKGITDFSEPARNIMSALKNLQEAQMFFRSDFGSEGVECLKSTLVCINRIVYYLKKLNVEYNTDYGFSVFVLSCLSLLIINFIASVEKAEISLLDKCSMAMYCWEVLEGVNIKWHVLLPLPENVAWEEFGDFTIDSVDSLENQ